MPDSTKIHPNLAARMRVVSMRSFGLLNPLRVIVKYRAGVTAVAPAIDGIQSTVRTFRLISATTYTALTNGINELSERDDVEMIWFDEPVHTMLDVSIPLIGVPAVWQAGATGTGIQVAVVDTGIDATHPDFANRISQIKDFTGEGLSDNNGHGTHVAGIIGGTGAASGGKYKGVAPACTLLAAKVLRGDGSGSTSDVMAGIEWAVQQGVHVINMSLGSDGACDGTDALSTLCDAAVARGIVLCVAAGNAGPGASTVGSPGCAKTVISVGATTDTDQVAEFSSRGPTSDGRVKPDVCFPGAGIVACRATGTSMGSPVNNLYTSASGTSMATPQAAGACALLLQAKPGLSPQQIKGALMNSATDLGLDPNTQGKGRAQMLVAYQSVLGQTPTPQPPGPTPPPQPPSPTPTPPGTGCFQMVKTILSGR